MPCPPNYNPSDHYVNVLAVSPGKEDECKKRIKAVCDAYQESEEGKKRSIRLIAISLNIMKT